MASEEIKVARAKKACSTLCTHLDSIGLKYSRHDDDKVITLTMHGDDLPIEMLLAVIEKQEVIPLLSPIRPKVPEDKRIDAAVAVNVANYGIVFGSFDYDISDGELRWRAVLPYGDNGITEDQIRYLVMVSAHAIDNYNDKFMMLSKGMMKLEQFIEAEKAE